MVDIASVPLMDDMEEGEGRKDMEGGGIDSDFSYNNNVAGASKHIRLGTTIFPIHSECLANLWQLFCISGFMRKVYGLLAVQLTITTIIGAWALIN